jgi:hypothetical protein
VRRRAAVFAVFLLVTAAAPATAMAEIGTIQLVSKTATEQATEALAPALSADGRFVAFQGTLGGLKGVFREELATGEVVPVAAGLASEQQASPGEPRDAAAPSISADGRYVSFSTAARLDPLDDLQADSKDVYVADMATTPPTYELASARDGCRPGGGCGLTYSGAGGSVAAGRVALSANGREVAFITTAISDLGAAVPGSETTPAGQVVVRNLETDTTTLVSAARDPETGQMEPGVPVAGGAVLNLAGGNGPTAEGAALSTDGTTVAWLGAHLPAQVPLAPEEAKVIEADDQRSELPYDEPLWRRIADGPTAPTRRVVGAYPGMLTKSENRNLASGWLGAEAPTRINGIPALSADGYEVVLIGNPVDATNLFRVDMHGEPAVTRLTAQVPVRPSEESAVLNHEQYVPLNGDLYDLAISTDGTRIAFATARQQFPLAPPNLISEAPSSLGLVELYLMDLENQTLRRVTHGSGGVNEASLGAGTAEAGNGATAPSFGRGSGLIAFASTATNLVAGDGNEASDVFTVENSEAPRSPGVVAISAAAGQKRPKGKRRLRLSAFSLPDGEVKLVAVVPAAGPLRAKVGASVSGVGRQRDVAAGSGRATGAGPVKLTMTLPGGLRHLAHRREGLYGVALVTFRPRRGKKLRGKVQVRFRVHAAKHRGTRGKGSS